MKLLTCPMNGPRNISEFSYGGEFSLMPDDSMVSSRDWTEYVFFHENKAGVVLEWWCHNPTSFWFLAERDTVRDEVIRTFEAEAYLTEIGHRE